METRAKELMRPIERPAELLGDSELSFHDNVGQTVLDFEDQLAKENMTKEEGLDNVLRDSRLKVPLPDDKDYTKTSRGNNKLLFIYTDFEPDGMNSFRQIDSSLHATCSCTLSNRTLSTGHPNVL